MATALRTGRWQEPLPGVVVAHSGPLSARQRWCAALAYGGPGAVLSHRSHRCTHARWHLDAAAWERDLRRANALQATGLRLLRFGAAAHV